jgi:hypothetical protein
MKSSNLTKRPAFRKQLILPAEHGAWVWLLVPYATGLLVAQRVNAATALVLVGGVALFLMRQPATIWLRARQGRGRSSDGPLAQQVLFGLVAVTAAALFALLALGLWPLLWLAVPLTGVLAGYVAVAQQRRVAVRSLGMEVAGAIGLAVMAPAATIAASGRVDGVAWGLWALLAGQNALGALYVRVRIADTHGRSAPRQATLLAHGAVLLLFVVAAGAALVPALAVLPFMGFFGRMWFLTKQPRPVPDIKRFGFAELAVEIGGGLIFALSYLAVAP